LKNGFVFAGSNAYKTEKIQSVKEVFREITIEYEMAGLRDNNKQLSMPLPILRDEEIVLAS